MAETLKDVPQDATDSAPQARDPRPAFAVVEELRAKFGDSLLLQATHDDMPTLWVERSQLLEVLMFLRTLPKPYVSQPLISRCSIIYCRLSAILIFALKLR
jgi:hypothetical protein